MESCSDWNKELEEIAESFPLDCRGPAGTAGPFPCRGEPARRGRGRGVCRVSAFPGTCGARPPRARRRRNMGSAGTERRDEEETWRLDLSGA